MTIQTIKNAIEAGKKVTFQYQAKQYGSSFRRTVTITGIEPLSTDWFRVKANGMWQQAPITELKNVEVSK